MGTKPQDDIVPEDLIYKDEKKRLSEMEHTEHLGSSTSHTGFRASWSTLSHKRHTEGEADAAIRARVESHLDLNGRSDRILTVEELDLLGGAHGGEEPVEIQDVGREALEREEEKGEWEDVHVPGVPHEQSLDPGKAFEEAKRDALDEIRLMEEELGEDSGRDDRRELSDYKLMVGDARFAEFFVEEYENVCKINSHESQIDKMSEFDIRGEAWGRAVTRYDEIAKDDVPHFDTPTHHTEVKKTESFATHKKTKKPRFFKRK